MLSAPANDYVRRFIDSVDTTKVLTVKHIMTVPGSVIKKTDGANVALNSMRASGVSSAYVVSDYMHFDGIITLEGALSVRDGKKTLKKPSFGRFLLYAILMLQFLPLSLWRQRRSILLL